MDGAKLRDELLNGPAGRYVYIARIGWLGVLDFKGFTGRDPKTGQPREIPAKRKIVFIQGYEKEDGSTKALRSALRDQQDRALEDDASVDELAAESAAQIRDGLASAGTFAIAGLGTFIRRKKKDRKTGAEHDIVVFKPSED